MIFSVFWHLFYAIFLTSIAVGPVFITISSIGLTNGLKHSLFAVIGVIIGNCIYLTIGALTAQQIINAIPNSVMMFVSFCASLFLARVAYGFFTRDLSNMQNDVYFSISVKTILKMMIITLSSPVVISGYVITFLTFAELVRQSFVSGCLGGLSATIIAYSLVAIVSGVIGDKVQQKVDKNKYYMFLKILNKIAGCLLGGFALMLIGNFVRTAVKTLL